MEKIEKLRIPKQKATLLFLIKDDKVLLAMKKRGFGRGKYNGVGGKPEKGESLDNAIVRETKEEIGMIPKRAQQVAKLIFYFLHRHEWDQQVVVYTTKTWGGRPKETEEMKPGWCDINKIPYDRMWSADPLWLPHVLFGKRVNARFIFDRNEGVKEYKVSITNK